MSKPSRQQNIDHRDGVSGLSGRCIEDGDRYYRTMTDLATRGRHDLELARRTLELGTAYLKCLDK